MNYLDAKSRTFDCPMPELVSSTKITEQTDDGSGCIGIEKKLREERKKTWMTMGNGDKYIIFFFYWEQSTEARIQTKGAFQEDRNRDFTTSKKLNYMFNYDIVGYYHSPFFFFFRIRMFQKVIGYFIGIRNCYCYLLMEVWLI